MALATLEAKSPIVVRIFTQIFRLFDPILGHGGAAVGSKELLSFLAWYNKLN
jgi:hypothetical protein